jgi:hypothetical protein
MAQALPMLRVKVLRRRPAKPPMIKPRKIFRIICLSSI